MKVGPLTSAFTCWIYTTFALNGQVGPDYDNVPAKGAEIFKQLLKENPSSALSEWPSTTDMTLCAGHSNVLQQDGVV